jgi:methylglutaconyl-CoA hydratase
MSELAIDASAWRNADWAAQKGLYCGVYPSTESMDEAIQSLAERLAQSNPEAMSMLKSVFWQGTSHWDQLLEERAAMSGKLVLSEFTRNAIASFKAK